MMTINFLISDVNFRGTILTVFMHEGYWQRVSCSPDYAKRYLSTQMKIGDRERTSFDNEGIRECPHVLMGICKSRSSTDAWWTVLVCSPLGIRVLSRACGESAGA